MRGEYITPDDYAAAEKIGVSAKNVWQRVNSLGWSIQRAISTPPMRTKSYRWREFEELALKNGVGNRTFVGRVYDGWDPEKAASTPPLSRREVAVIGRNARTKKHSEI